MRISIVIPAGREEAEVYRRIAEFSRLVRKLLEEHGYSCEIIVVSDVYTQENLKSLSLLSSKEKIRSIVLTRRLGKGGSIRNALHYAKGELIALLDADIPVTPKYFIELVRFFTNLGNIDILVAYRKHRPGILRKALSRIYNVMVNLFFKTGIRDHQTGLKILSAKAKNIFLSKTVSNILAYDTELLVKARNYGLKIVEAPTLWLKAPRKSTIPIVKMVAIITLELLSLISTLKRQCEIEKVKVGEALVIEGTAVATFPEYRSNCRDESIVARVLRVFCEKLLETT